MALKSRKIPVGFWIATNFVGGYAHQKLIDTDPQLASHCLINNLAIPLFPGTFMTLRDSVVDREELYTETIGNPATGNYTSISSPDIYRENLAKRAAFNFATSCIPYVAGRLVAKVI